MRYLTEGRTYDGKTRWLPGQTRRLQKNRFTAKVLGSSIGAFAESDSPTYVVHLLVNKCGNDTLDKVFPEPGPVSRPKRLSVAELQAGRLLVGLCQAPKFDLKQK